MVGFRAAQSEPRFNSTGNDGEKRVSRDFPKFAKFPIPFRITKPQFTFQVTSLMFQLPLGDGQSPGQSFSGDLGGIEGISSPSGLVMDGPKVGRDCRHRRSTVPKPVQLWMGAIPFRLPLQDLLGKQSFPPESNQALLIQERWME